MANPPPEEVLDIYSTSNLVSGVWEAIGSAAAPSNAPGVEVEVPHSALVGGETNIAFFAMGLRVDLDGDGLTDSYERLVSCTDPNLADTDGDGLPDGWEVRHGLDPLSATGRDGPAGDPDGDEAPNWLELSFGTSPVSSDTDGDGLSDAAEMGSVQSLNRASHWTSMWRLATTNKVAFASAADITNRFVFSSPVHFAGEEYQSMTVSPHGYLHLHKNAEGDIAPSFTWGDLDDWTLNDSGTTIAAYWAALSFSADSSIRVFETAYGLTFAEYSGMRLPGGGSVSFQIVLSNTARQVSGLDYGVEIVYGSFMENAGADAYVGFRTPGGRHRATFCRHAPGRMSSYLDVSFFTGAGTDPLRQDSDLDGLDDPQELSLGLDPLEPDTDGDGMDDGWENRHSGFDPAVGNGADMGEGNDQGCDLDGDGLTNGDECRIGTDPLDSDTDGDGVGDGAEDAQGSDPLDASDGGLAAGRSPVRLYFGDDSGSHSEKYRLTLTPLDGPGGRPRVLSWLNLDYGGGEWRKAPLKLGWRYEVHLEWASFRRTNDIDVFPNYDYTLRLDPACPGNVVLDDPQVLFKEGYMGVEWYGKPYFPILDARARICALAPLEIIAPKVVGVNNDDDDGNGQTDWEEHGIVQNEDDLVEVTVRIHCPTGMTGTATVAALINGTVGDLFKDAAKSQPVGYDTFTVSGDMEKTYYLEGCNYSLNVDSECIRVTFQYGGATFTKDHKFTVVERIAEPITTERVNGQVVNPCCAILGESAPMQVRVLPESFPDSQIKWCVVSGAGSFPNGDTGRNIMFSPGGAEGATNVLQVDVGDVQGAAPQFRVVNATMHEVKIYPGVIHFKDEANPITQFHLDTMLAEVNTIFRQVGIHFSYGAPITNVTNDVWAENGLVKKSVGSRIRNIMTGTDGLEVYFIPGKNVETARDFDEPLGEFNAYGIILKNICNAKTMAHEIGHACGWDDAYIKRKKYEPSELFQGLRRGWMPDDWNNGSGCRFYDPMLSQRDIICRVLMHGEGGNVKTDIPSGLVHALSAGGTVKKVNVGIGGIITTEPFSH